LTGCNAKDPAAVVAEPLPVAPSSAAADPTQPAMPSDEPSPSDSPAASPSPTHKPLPTYDVKAVQRQLADLHYYAGAIDGERGPSFHSAVMAFQKVQGIGADGVVGKGTLAALKTPRTPSLKASPPASRVEVDLTKQVL